MAAPVRDRILEICKRNLAPNGVAYVSYNTYPGWYQRGMLRAMMVYHTRGITDPTERVRQARAVVDFVARSASPPDGLHAQYLREEHRKVEKHHDTYLFHEYLEADNHPVYFHEFVAHAAQAGLRYLSTAQFRTEEARLSADFQQVISQTWDRRRAPRTVHRLCLEPDLPEQPALPRRTEQLRRAEARCGTVASAVGVGAAGEPVSGPPFEDS